MTELIVTWKLIAGAFVIILTYIIGYSLGKSRGAGMILGWMRKDREDDEIGRRIRVR